MKSFYIIDVSNMFYRAFYGLDPLSTPDGRPVQALHGFLSMVTSIMRDKKPDYVAFALESDGPSFRKGIYPAYKGNRTEPHEDLQFQINQLPRLLAALNYPTFKAEGFEADDVIGTLAKYGAQHSLEVFIVSSDKDFCQLVDDRIKLYDHMKGIMYGPMEVLAKHGVKPEQFIDYLSITGDSSDNIPGVDGIGPKGAAKYLMEYGDVVTLYENLGELKPKQREKLEASAADVKLSKNLATIITAVPLPTLSLEALTFRGYNEPLLKAFLGEFGLRHHAREMFAETQSVDGVEIGKRI